MPGRNCQSKTRVTIHNQLPPVTNCDQLLLPQVHLMVSILLKWREICSAVTFLSLGGRLQEREEEVVVGGDDEQPGGRSIRRFQLRYHFVIYLAESTDLLFFGSDQALYKGSFSNLLTGFGASRPISSTV